jgi:crotonobetainyl-CoA:carnitine CoA-transferase CaiB-like acyl-CoA transferase
MLNHADIPNSKAYTAADCAADPQYLERGMVREVEDPLIGMKILHPGIVPHMPESPGTIRWTGPEIGQHNAEVFGELLGLTPENITALQSEGVI